jgi:drug/metabolite transporter (DMT)-like permease
MKDPPAPHHSPARGGSLQEGRGAVSAWAVHRPGGRDVALLSVAVVGVSLSAPLTALVTAPMLALAFWRNAAGAAVLLPVLLTRERSTLTGLHWRDLRSSVVAGLFLAAHFAAWLPSLSMTTVAASTALVTTTPIWTALAARITGVRLPAAVWWGLILAVVGVALIAGVDIAVSTRALAGDGLALLGAVCAAGYVLAGARARQRLATSAYAVVAYSVCALTVAVAAIAVDVPLAGFTARDWWLIAAITVCAQLLGHTLLNLVLSTVGPTVVSLAVLLEVPGALLFALVLLQQAPPLLALPGVALVVAGVALVVRGSRPTTLVEPAT